MSRTNFILECCKIVSTKIILAIYLFNIHTDMLAFFFYHRFEMVDRSKKNYNLNWQTFLELSPVILINVGCSIEHNFIWLEKKTELQTTVSDMQLISCTTYQILFSTYLYYIPRSFRVRRNRPHIQEYENICKKYRCFFRPDIS